MSSGQVMMGAASGSQLALHVPFLYTTESVMCDEANEIRRKSSSNKGETTEEHALAAPKGFQIGSFCAKILENRSFFNKNPTNIQFLC